MDSSPSKYPETILTIDRFNKRGRGIGSFQRPRSPQLSEAEVISGLPGDELRIELGAKRKGRFQGFLKEVLKPSALRVVPRCIHVPDCGGCSWQQMQYEGQLAYKQAMIEKIFASQLAANQVEIRQILPCPSPWHYRNKMEFSFSQNKAGEKFLGLIKAGSKGRVINLSECHLVSSWFINTLSAVRKWWEESSLHAYRMDDSGSLRTLTLREGKHTGDKMVFLTVSGNPDYALKQSQLNAFIEEVRKVTANPERLSIFLRIQQVQKGTPTQFYEMHLGGPDHILEQLTIDTIKGPIPLQFKISPISFFQPNSSQAQALYSQALKLVSFPKKHVLDLYAGTATLGIAMALQAEKVTAIELNPHAVFDAESNKERNGITNLEVICGDVGQKLKELFPSSQEESPDLIVVDPPRTGLDATAIELLKQLKAKEILYISCNPETQEANIQELCKGGYRLVILQPVDQFPHTVHIENIALLRLDLRGAL